MHLAACVKPRHSTFIVHVCTACDIISCSPKYHHKLQEIKNQGKDCLQVGLCNQEGLKNAVVVLVARLDIIKELVAMMKSLQSMRGDH